MVDAILGVIGTLLYPLFAIFFVLIDLVQNIFRTFAGVGTVWYKKNTFNYDKITSGEGDNLLADDNGGIVYYLLRSDLVMNLVWSIATLALILLIVFTVIAFIRNIYSPKSKSWQEIIGLSVKGLFNFIFIPVVCLLGVILGNILLNAIDGATSTGGSTTMSRKLFLSAAYDANWIRMSNQIRYDQANEAIKLHNSVFNKGIPEVTIPDGKKSWDVFTKDANEIEYYANLVDEAYGEGGVFWTDHHNWISVEAFYSLPRINYLTLAVGGVFIMYALGSISFGMIKRLFTLIMLFIISPAACAMYPLDEGNACKQITGDFKKNTISAYGAVAGMNIFFSIVPLVENINISDTGVGVGITAFLGVANIIHLILLTCGLFMVKDFISMISNYFGAGNAYESGASMMKQTKEKIAGTSKKVVSGAFRYGTNAVANYREQREAGHGRIGSFFRGSIGSIGNDVGRDLTGIDVQAGLDARANGDGFWRSTGQALRHFNIAGTNLGDDIVAGVEASRTRQAERRDARIDREDRDRMHNAVTDALATGAAARDVVRLSDAAGYGDVVRTQYSTSGGRDLSLADVKSDDEKLKSVLDARKVVNDSLGRQTFLLNDANWSTNATSAMTALMLSAGQIQTRMQRGDLFNVDVNSIIANEGVDRATAEDLASNRRQINAMVTEYQELQKETIAKGEAYVKAVDDNHNKFNEGALATAANTTTVADLRQQVDMAIKNGAASLTDAIGTALTAQRDRKNTDLRGIINADPEGIRREAERKNKKK